MPWMPKELPPHVKILFSCLPDDKYNVLEAFTKHWGGHEENKIEIGKLPVNNNFNLIRNELLTNCEIMFIKLILFYNFKRVLVKLSKLGVS